MLVKITSIQKTDSRVFDCVSVKVNENPSDTKVFIVDLVLTNGRQEAFVLKKQEFRVYLMTNDGKTFDTHQYS